MYSSRKEPYKQIIYLRDDVFAGFLVTYFANRAYFMCSFILFFEASMNESYLCREGN